MRFSALVTPIIVGFALAAPTPSVDREEYGPVIVRAAAIDARRLDSSATTSHEKRGFLLESDGTGSQAEFDKRGLQFSDDRTEKRAPREEADKRAAREETD